MHSRAAKKELEWQRKDRDESIGKIKVGCILGMLLVPSFAMLDFISYPDLATEFLFVRLACSGLIGAFLAVLYTDFGRRNYRALGVSLVLLPGSAISFMIYATEGAHSPYYAGLNLVLLVVGFVLRWTYRESFIAVSLVCLEYIIACVFNDSPGPIENHPATDILNNLYFMAATGIIVVTGNYFFSRARYHEFELAFDLAEQTERLEASNKALEENKAKLEESNRKLLELDQVKSRFFANISHELRTPLTLLLAPLETLLQKHASSLDREAVGMMQTMHSNAMRLLKLINDLLDLVRLESGRIEVKHDLINMAEFTKGLASAARQVAEDKRLRLESFVDPQLGKIVADRDKLEKIILNLVFNALKFTPAGGRVDLRAEVRENQFVIVVADTGMGIASKNLPFIFDRFWQADGSSKRKYQGTGIGLALVKELTEIQGGRVLVESEEGKGTRFQVFFPLHRAVNEPEPERFPETAAELGGVTSEEWLSNLYRRAELFPALTPVHQSVRPVETSKNGHLPTVLIADDEPDMLRFLKTELGSRFRVVEAVDGAQAVEKAFHFLPALVVLDMMMPHKDGLQACREIREHTPTQGTPILMLTARADEETKLTALSAGASDFLTKPFSTTELHVRIKNLVESHEYQRNLARKNLLLENTIEQLKQTESRLVQSEKMNSLMRWSAEIIHQMNNPLNYANMALESLRGKASLIAESQRPDYTEVLDDARDGVMRVRDIVTQLKRFAHPETECRDHVPVAGAVNTALRFLRYELDGPVQVTQSVPPEQTAWVNESLLIHVLMNLLQNSVDALRQKTFQNEVPAISISGRTQGGTSILVIRDNGIGIKEEDKGKIFDPFFTTKEVGKGMGLGLSICHRIVQECGGLIDFVSEPGVFCEFTLEFPTKEEPHAEQL